MELLQQQTSRTALQEVSFVDKDRQAKFSV